VKHVGSLAPFIGLIAFGALAGTAPAQQIVFEEDFSGDDMRCKGPSGNKGHISPRHRRSWQDAPTQAT